MGDLSVFWVVDMPFFSGSVRWWAGRCVWLGGGGGGGGWRGAATGGEGRGSKFCYANVAFPVSKSISIKKRRKEIPPREKHSFL